MRVVMVLAFRLTAKKVTRSREEKHRKARRAALERETASALGDIDFQYVAIDSAPLH